MRKKVVVVGAGGHAKVVAEILESDPSLEIAGTVSNREDQSRLWSYPDLGDDHVLPFLRAQGITCAFAAIGDNAARKRIFELLTRLGFEPVNAVSRYAVISRRASLGSGIAIMPGCVINADAAIASGAIVNTGATVDHDSSVGPFAHLAPGVNVAGNVQIGGGALIGIGAKLIPGVCVGEWSVVGAGAVVVRNIAARSKAKGVPAKAYAASDRAPL